MNFLRKIKSIVQKGLEKDKASKSIKTNKSKVSISNKGMLTFAHTGEVIQAESLLKKAGFEVEVKAPPPALHSGCDMIIVIDLISEVAIMDILTKHNNEPLAILSIEHDLLKPVSLYHMQDFGQWLMVRAANMKITVDKESHIIVNISGGGCPDVPYLAHKLLGITLEDAIEPRYIGQTLCCYSLQKAFIEARRLLCGL